MQPEINFLCSDSVLATPIVLDLVLFTDLAQRAGMAGTQEWRSFYFKSTQHARSVYPEHDLFIQYPKLRSQQGGAPDATPEYADHPESGSPIRMLVPRGRRHAHV